MLNKNDPLIGVVQEVMKKNQAERDAANLVNEYFGITDRKALPHERQGEWDAAYQTVLTEGINVPDVSYQKTEKNGNSDRRIITKDTKNVFSGGTTTMQKVDKNVSKSGSNSTTEKIKSQDLGKNKKLGGKDYNVSTSTVYKSKKVNEEELDEANFPGAPSVKMPRSMAGDKHTKMYGDLHSKLKSLADSGKINTPEGRKEASGHIDAIQNLVDKHLPGNPVPSKKTWLSEDQLEEASLAGLAPPFEKTTRKDVLVGRGVLEKHPTQPGKHVLAKEDMSPNPTSAPSSQPSATSIRKAATKVKVRMGGNPTSQPNSNRPANAYRKAATKVKVRMGGNPTNAPSSSPSQSGSRPMEEGSDVTSPSGMGIKKPDYATGTPAYAKSKEQTVNRTDKTSLPPGTVAKNIKEEQINERAPRPESMGSQVRGQTTYGTQAMTGMPSRSAPADRAGTSAMTGMPSRSAPANRAGTSAMTGMPSRSASTRQTSTGAQIGGARPSPSVGGNSGALANAARGQRTSNAIRNLNTPGLRTTNKVNAAGQTKGPNVGLPQKSTAVRPAAGGARPSVIAKNSITRRGMGWTPSGPATNAGVTALNKQTSQQVPNSGSAKPAAAPAPAAAAPAPAAAKPAAAKVTPVRKQSSAGAAKPAKRNRLTRNERDSAVVGPGGRLG